MISAYLNLTKPRISLLFALTGLTVLLMHRVLIDDPWRIAFLTLAIFMTGGAANALNQYFERDRDKLMARTAKKRPLPQGLISPNAALVFSLSLGVGGIFILSYLGDPLALVFGLGTILFYSFYYTLYLKPRTPYNIVIGGVPGAMGPLIAYAAVKGGMSWVPFLMFLIVFFWTPPHFWALALCCKDDYAKVGIPMLPLVKGDEFTRKQIVYYSLTLLPLSLILYRVGHFGILYLIAASVLGILFILGSIWIYREKTIKSYWAFFAYSILYLLLLFGSMMMDVLIR